MAKKQYFKVDLKAVIIGALVVILAGAVIARFMSTLCSVAIAFAIGGILAAYIAKDKTYLDGARTGAVAGVIATIIMTVMSRLNLGSSIIGKIQPLCMCANLATLGETMTAIIFMAIIGAALGGLGGAVGSTIRE